MHMYIYYVHVGVSMYIHINIHIFMYLLSVTEGLKHRITIFIAEKEKLCHRQASFCSRLADPIESIEYN